MARRLTYFLWGRCEALLRGYRDGTRAAEALRGVLGAREEELVLLAGLLGIFCCWRLTRCGS